MLFKKYFLFFYKEFLSLILINLILNKILPIIDEGLRSAIRLCKIKEILNNFL